VTSIAVVHELLSATLDGEVNFDAIVDRLVTTTREVAAGGEVTVSRKGAFGIVPATEATPLALVLTELLQNAIEHGLRHGPGHLEVMAERNAQGLTVTVSDDGTGLTPGFTVEACSGLGLQIVRTLLEGELSGSLALTERPGGGTSAIVRLPGLQA
jgi:two-component sensor histidine kinase